MAGAPFFRAPARTALAGALLAAASFACASTGAAQAPAPPPPASVATYSVIDTMIPMRDGVKLHTRILSPKGSTSALPIIFLRTPYGVAGEKPFRILDGWFKAMADEQYHFVFQDIRGKFGSEGTFVMQRPARPVGATTGISEGTDAYDTIDWLVTHVPNNNGRAGMLGVSYDGWTTIMAATEPHPALRAISPQASPADMWLGDDFHHNGAFRLSYGFEYATELESGKELKNFEFDRYDTYDWYLRLGSLANVNAKILQGRIPTWNDFAAHPDWDQFWQRQTVIPYLREVTVPTLNVAGWWDQEDFYGPLAIYEALEKKDPKRLNYLVVGPWNHGGWTGGAGDRLGAIPFDSATGVQFRERVQAPWFAYWLKDKGTLDLPEALTFEAGSNRWRRWESWPAKGHTEERPLYMAADGALSWNKPTEAAGKDSYVADPAHPVPYRHRPIQPTYFPFGSGWRTWLVEDQRFVGGRSDVLSWETAVLEEDLTIAGEVVANLVASTTGTDADWVVKLIDVYPEQYPSNWALAGFQLMVSNEVFRGRYRGSFEKPAPIAPNVPVPFRFSLHTQDYTFRKGHRIMVQVQSSWFPIIDRNPQTWVPNIFEAKAGDFRPATQTIWRSAARASHVVLPVVVR